MANGRKGSDPRSMRPAKVRHAHLQAMLAPELLEAALCSVRLLGDSCVMVENHRGLCVLGTERVTVATGCGLLEVRGEGLSLCEVRPDALIVRGRIEGVRFPRA